MARKAIIEREKKRKVMVERYAQKRAELKSRGDWEALSKLPRNASPTRLHNRDRLDGRPRGYLRDFEVSRLNFRRLALAGKIPGVKKASW